jgi:hypothetical protein
LTSLREIVCELLLLFGQFFGYKHPSNGQFPGICLKESQPLERTFAGQMQPFERTFGRVNAPDKPTLPLILMDLAKRPTPNTKTQVLRLSLLAVG